MIMFSTVNIEMIRYQERKEPILPFLTTTQFGKSSEKRKVRKF